MYKLRKSFYWYTNPDLGRESGTDRTGQPQTSIGSKSDPNLFVTMVVKFKFTVYWTPVPYLILVMGHKDNPTTFVGHRPKTKP